jgi:hypothetical protein
MLVKVEIGRKNICVEGEWIGLSNGLFKIIHRRIEFAKSGIYPTVVDRPNWASAAHFVEPGQVLFRFLPVACASFHEASPRDGVGNVRIQVFPPVTRGRARQRYTAGQEGWTKIVRLGDREFPTSGFALRRLRLQARDSSN